MSLPNIAFTPASVALSPRTLTLLFKSVFLAKVASIFVSEILSLPSLASNIASTTSFSAAFVLRSAVLTNAVLASVLV
ncbi:hypothetical protein H9I48_02400 [Wolbachia pipientis]|uniref:hypothetical protein n=1 Tax=Wolbachia pipientis TaxID=955 RepID=UPI0016513996|nr:hypothetical protein [Wolbachia pipientis]MBC6686092.1 hypothetical protein [Wolbachia pipientis]